MMSSFRNSQLFKAIVISINLNALMIVLGVVGNAVKSLSILAKVSGVIAAPTGFLLGWLIHPSGKSLPGIVLAAIEGFIASIVLYTLIAWIVLQWLQRRSPSKKNLPQS